MITYEIHDQYIRGKQYELFYDLMDGENVVLGNQTRFVGEDKLDEAGIDTLMVTKIIPQFEAQEEVIEEQLYSKTEVEQILKDKGYLSAEQCLEDLPIKEMVVK